LSIAEITLDLKLPITIVDELDEELVESTGTLDLASGDIEGVTYKAWDVKSQGVPAAHPDYDFTTGTLTNGRQDVEFGIVADVLTGKYSVTPSELLELKGRSAKLFSGQTDGQPSVTPIKPPGRRGGAAR
jgi:hypothetical protein